MPAPRQVPAILKASSPIVSAVTVFVFRVFRLLCSTRELSPIGWWEPAWQQRSNRVAKSLELWPSTKRGSGQWNLLTWRLTSLIGTVVFWEPWELGGRQAPCDLRSDDMCVETQTQPPYPTSYCPSTSSRKTFTSCAYIPSVKYLLGIYWTPAWF